MKQLIQRVGWPLLGLCCLLSGLVASSSIPLDSHEIFVAETAQEMIQRGDWIVPYFNGEPRLNKPPVSYWATAAIASVAGAAPRVSEIHARLVSVLAGCGVLLCAVLLGTILYDGLTGTVAGFLLVGSAGLFSFMHDARPDLLYACWISAMMAAVAWAAYRTPRRPTPLIGASGVAWLCCALAVLTKRPHIPALVMIGLALHLRWEAGSWRAVAAILRPLYGLALVAALCLPWWGLLEHRLDAQQVKTSQLAGKLLVPALSRLGNPYYLYRPVELLLPWLPLIVVAGLFAPTMTSRKRMGFMVVPLLVTAFGLSLGRQYRFFYMLPLLSGMAVLLARPLVDYWQGNQTYFRTRVLNVALGVQGLLVVACAGWVIKQAVLAHTLLGSLACIALGVALAGVSIRQWPAASRSQRIALATALMMASLWPAAALTGKLWGSERYGAHRIARLAVTELRSKTPLVVWGVSPTVYVYYSERRVANLASTAALEQWLRQSPTQELGLVTRAPELVALSGRFQMRELGRYHRGDTDDVLVVLSSAPTPRTPALKRGSASP